MVWGQHQFPVICRYLTNAIGAFLGPEKIRDALLGKTMRQKNKYKSESVHQILMIFSRHKESLQKNQHAKLQLNILKIENLMIISVLQVPINC